MMDNITEVSKNIDEIEEVKKYNHNHGPDGRFTSANGVGGAAGKVDEDANPDYRYHSTSFRNARSIQDEGEIRMSTHAQYGPGVYFAPDVEGTKGWTSEENEQVQLRVKHKDLKEKYKYDEFDEQGWTDKNVSTVDVEIKVGDQRWVNIDDADIRDDEVFEW